MSNKGKPVPFLDVRAAYQECRAEFDEAYGRVMQSGRWILGQEGESFEAEFSAYCSTKHCVGVGNGLDALFLALRALRVGPGDEIIVPAHTFIATWLAIRRTGASPVPVEPQPGSFLPSAAEFEARVTPRTRAVVVVHLYGEISGVQDIARLCAARGIFMIEDAAQAHGARIGVQKAGTYGDVGCFSFYPSKNLGAFGDAGAVVTGNPELADVIRKLRNYGGISRYAHEVDGVNSRLDELQAAFLRVQLPYLDRRNDRRKSIAAMYLTRLSGIDELVLPAAHTADAHVWHLFVVQTVQRDDLQRFLLAQNCETLVHYPKPVYRTTPFESFGPRHESTSDRLASSVLSLPMGPHLTDEQVNLTCDYVKQFFARKRPR